MSTYQTYQTPYFSAVALFRVAALMHVAAGHLRTGAKSLHAWLETRRRAAVATHEFERMSDRTLRDIGLSRADMLRVAWGIDRDYEPF
jgi:uncharacterized protein YjiS (DUF1127 family)